MGIIKINHKNKKHAEKEVEVKDVIDETNIQDQDVANSLVDAEENGVVTQDNDIADMEQIDVIDMDRAIVSEDESQITENSRLYYLNNGTAKSVISATPVNYFDEDDKEWKKIDNTLTDVGDEYENAHGAFKTRISKAETRRSVRVGKKDMQVMWEYKGKQRSADEPVPTVDEMSRSTLVSLSEEEEMPITTLQVGEKRVHGRKGGMRKHRRLSDKAVYNNVERNTDLEYQLYGDHIKENIIVKEKSDFYRYVFALQTQGLKMRLSEDNLQIELYRDSVGKGGVVEQIVEFTIPAPYMYDAAGNTCDDVFYEIEPEVNGQSSFAVVANAEWINAEKRMFPVTIDPQIVINSNSVITKRNERRTISVDSCLAKHYSSWSTVSGNNITVSANKDEEYRATITVKRSELKVLNKRIASAKLILTLTQSTGGYINVDKNKEYIPSGSNKFTIDLTKQLTGAATSDITIALTPNADTRFVFSASATPPVIEIEYLTNERIKECTKQIDLVANATGFMDVSTGEFTPEIGLASGEGLNLNYGISQIFKQSSDDYSCGTNFRLNLHESLNKNGDNYIYTDKYGVAHGFVEHFYYLNSSNQKVYVNKSFVQTNEFGELYDSSNHTIIREEVSDSGLQATTQLSGISGVQYLEQRQNEIKQLEEQVEQYVNAIKQFVVVDVCKKEILFRFRNLDNFKRYRSFVSSCAFVMTESEAYSVLGSALQRTSLEYQDKSFELQDTSIKLTKKQLELQKSDKNASSDLKNVYGSQISNYTEQQTLNEGIRANSAEQLELVITQLEDVPYKSNQNITLVESYYKEYINRKAELEMRKKATPVHYIMDGELIKGFNNDGELVVISDQYNNVIAVERDTKGRISRVYDEKEHQIVFKYNVNGLLSSVTDVRGRCTKIQRTVSNTTTLTYYNGKVLKLTTSSVSASYNNLKYVCITGIELKDYASVQLRYDGILLTKVENYCLYDSISHGKVVAGQHKLSTTTIAYTPNKTQITETGDIVRKETYKFNATGNLAEYYVEEDDKVVQAEQYDYVNACGDDLYNAHDNVVYAKKDSLNKVALASFKFEPEDFTNVTLDEFNSPKRETNSWKTIHEENGTVITRQKTEKEYEYNDDRKLIEEKTITKTEKDNAVSTVAGVKKYYYNDNGSVVRTESYIEGEELTAGISIEETEYNDKGGVIKSFTYNSLDSSSKFYSENEVDESGKVVAEIDETGENKTTLEYIAGTDVVRTKTMPNGSKLSYGHDFDNNITSITQSTEEGESNSNQIEYTNGAITKLTSSNNTVMYKYDHKLRKTAVYLNSNQPYVTFSYIEDKSVKRKTVTAKMLNCDIAVTVSDFHDNVIKTQYGETVLTQSQYDAFDKVTQIEDKLSGNIANFSYDTLDRITQYKDNSITETYTYNADGNIERRAVSGGNYSETYTYAYKSNAAKDLDSVTVGSVTVTHKTDVQGRNAGKEIYYGKGNKISEENIYYRKVGDHATNMPVSMRFGSLVNGKYSILDRLQYKYDSCGNIIEVRENDVLQARYEYDKLKRIVREDNKVFGKTWLYSYDYNGNILSKKEYAFTLKTGDELEELDSETIVYGYYGDRLMSFGEELCDYDLLGNPTQYKGIDLSWVRGRQLARYGNIQFEYDGQGRRIKKGNIAFTYDSNGKLLKQSNAISFIYDNNGVVGLKYDNKTYFYRKDIQGNIIAILDSTGDVVVEYTYDAWGNHAVQVLDETCSELSQLNPFRYRGYYYDTETGLYFLKTRYYDPEVGRFISMDDISYLDPETINGLNLYAYCGNNPVMNVDSDGNFFLSFLIGCAIAAGIGAAVGAVSYVASVAITAVFTGKWSWSWGQFLGSILGGAIGGVLSFALPGLGIIGSAAITGALSTSIGMGLSNAFGESHYTLKEILFETAFSAGLSAITAGITSKIKIPGFTGRGSISQVARQINTKFFNGTIKTIHASTLCKMIAYEAAYSVFSTIASSIIDIFKFYNTKPSQPHDVIITAG